MNTRQPFRCHLVGGESILIACAEILLERGHQVLGVATRDTAVGKRAVSKGIPVPKVDEALTDVLKGKPFDYPFSIGNLNILAPQSLRLPRQAAINFHDGPLPRYAGLNASVWALLHRERRHGIT